MSNLFKLCMFITSFVPLWISVCFIISFKISTNPHLVWMVIFIIIINLLSATYINSGIRSALMKPGDNYIIKGARKEKTITTEYLLSYILPLFAFDFTAWKQIVLFLIYFIILAFLCIRNNNVYANLLFEVRKYSFYSCDVALEIAGVTTAQEIIVISKIDICSKIGHQIRAASLNKPFYIDKG